MTYLPENEWRNAFEKWARDRHFVVVRKAQEPDRYADVTVQLMWQSFVGGATMVSYQRKNNGQRKAV